jgi:hypothetical protein
MKMMKYERELPFNVDVESLLLELLDYMENRQDSDHDGLHAIPNEEMNFVMAIRQALYQLEIEKVNS